MFCVFYIENSPGVFPIVNLYYLIRLFFSVLLRDETIKKGGHEPRTPSKKNLWLSLLLLNFLFKSNLLLLLKKHQKFPGCG